LYKKVSVPSFFAASGSLTANVDPEAFLWEYFKFDVISKG
jgi:hypothetical protein